MVVGEKFICVLPLSKRLCIFHLISYWSLIMCVCAKVCMCVHEVTSACLFHKDNMSQQTTHCLKLTSGKKECLKNFLLCHEVQYSLSLELTQGINDISKQTYTLFLSACHRLHNTAEAHFRSLPYKIVLHCSLQRNTRTNYITHCPLFIMAHWEYLQIASKHL